MIHALLQNWPWGAHSRTGRLELTACLHNVTCIVAGHVFHKKPSKQADMHTQRIHNMGESEWGKCPIVCTRYTVVVDLEEVGSYTFKSCQLLCSHVLRLQLPCGQLLEVKYPERGRNESQERKQPRTQGAPALRAFSKKAESLDRSGAAGESVPTCAGQMQTESADFVVVRGSVANQLLLVREVDLEHPCHHGRDKFSCHTSFGHSIGHHCSCIRPEQRFQASILYELSQPTNV